jgi:ethanolamine ammonia-lyase small subunit
MSESIKQGVVSSIVEPIITNPKVQMSIATGTTAAGIDMATIQYLQPVIAIVAATLGLILTTVLIVRNVFLMVDEFRDRKRKAKKDNEDTL